MIPDRQVGWGFVGAGMVARVALAPAVRAADGATLVAVAARDPARASALAAGGRAYGRYADLLADDGVDAVYCSLPNHAHLRWVRDALRAGKHVLCEKPLALDAGEVDELTSEAELAGRLLVEASWCRWHPRTRAAESLVSSGAIGRVLGVDAGFTFTNADPDGWRMEPGMGGGALYDVGCYALSACGWALGWAGLDVVEVRRRLAPSGVDLGTAARLRTRGPHPAEVTVRVSFDEAEGQWLDVRGDTGTLRLTPPAFTAWTADAAGYVLERPDGPDQPGPVTACDPYRLMVEAVSGRILGGDDWVVPLSESRATAAMLDSVRAAPAGGEP